MISRSNRIARPAASRAAIAGAPWIADSIPTDAPSGGHGEYAFPVTVEVGSQADQRYYRMAYPNSPPAFPSDLSIYYRFAPADGAVVYLEIPYDRVGTGKPSLVWYRDIFGMAQNVIDKSNLAELLSTNDHVAWVFLAQSLIMKLTSQTENAHPTDPFGTELEVRIL